METPTEYDHVGTRRVGVRHTVRRLADLHRAVD